MSTGSAIFFFAVAALFIGAAIYIFVLSVKKMANTFPPGGGATTSSRLKIFLFLIVAVLLGAIGGMLVLKGLFG